MELLFVQEKESQKAIAKRLAFAEELGHKEILLLFTKHYKGNNALVKEVQKDFKGVLSGILISTQNEAKALKQQYDVIVAPCKRDFFENKNVDFILEPERQGRADFIHHRNSGLHQVLLNYCKPTTKRQEKGIITTLSLLRRSRRSSELLGRMMQNARWCKKYKIMYHVTSGATKLFEQRCAAGLKALNRELLKR